MSAVRYEPVGALADIISEYIHFKHAQGLKYEIAENILYRFSVLSQNHEISGAKIPQPLLEEWFERRPAEKVTTFKGRCFTVSGLLAYAKDHGYRAEIPEIPRMRSENYVPYIFTEREITQFFLACDTLPPYVGSHRHEIVPVLFRLLYACGLRASEAAGLKISDVDLDRGVLTIREPKNRKDRYVPMSKTLTEGLRRFHLLTHDSEMRGEDFFFRGKYNDHITRCRVYKWFRLCLEHAGISHRGRGLGPREHDLRHTFCVHALKSMCAQGMDIYCALPVLSTCVGHKSIYATQQYLRLTAEMYPELLGRITLYAGGAIPEGWEEAEDETD
jgi:integrase